MASVWEIKDIAADEKLETCARQIIVTRFREMMCYKEGARDGRDIEFVHDMRVASRRLRTAMENFADCFPRKPFKKHYKQVKVITRTMGGVRDLDVLIARFQKELVTLSEVEQRDIRGLIEHLHQKREEARKPMLALFAKLETRGFEKKFLTFFGNNVAKPQKITGIKPNQSYRANAPRILPQWVEEVYKWECFIRDPARRTALHNMRISIKRLRYTMEIFGVVYKPKKRFTECVAVILDLQEILGDIHDCDVVLEVLTDYQETCQSAVLQGVATLIVRTCETRKTAYETFLEKWEQLSAIGFKQKLLSLLTS